ncbi:NB-ARC domain-containing protein [Micromonospora sp. KC606]|uniref:NB-ARC domain-containing protein n=1 Tax=Micromonospora sp. KC606 TaxID=2530379 RepID=UPI001FB6312A|nr:NB-ARC domain-containing protein [Micromonospora sp. KC606]
MAGEPSAYVGQTDAATEASQFLTAASALAAVVGSSSARPVVVLGQPGAGKTAFVTHVAHRLRDRFPDAQLYIEALSDNGQPAAPAEVAARILRSLGMPPDAVPAAFSERAAAVRAHLAARRVLVVVDDVVDEEQVCALLPASGHCAVLISARRRLAMLDGAETVELRPLSPAQGLAFLSSLLGPQRVMAEPAAAEAAVALCGGLPLALRAFASRLTARPHRAMRPLVERLADRSEQLPLLAFGATGMARSIDLSYRLLPDDARRLMRMLAVLPAAAFGSWIAAALLDAPLEDAEEALQRLVDACLVEVTAYGGPAGPRYRLHDLPQAFAADLLRGREALDQEEALLRVLGGWLAIAQEAQRQAFGAADQSPHAWLPRDRRGSVATDALRSGPPYWYAEDRRSLSIALAGAHDGALAAAARDVVEAMRPFPHLHDQGVPDVARAI